MKHIKLHINNDTPGCYVPPIIDIIERKISLIHQLRGLNENKALDPRTRHMIEIEMQSIYELVKIDGLDIDKPHND